MTETREKVASPAAPVEHRLVILNDGTVLSLDRDPAPAELSNVIKVASRSDRCLALQSDGSLVVWGSYVDVVPPGLPQINSIACGNTHSLVVLGDGSPQLENRPADRQLYPGDQTVFSADADGLLPLHFQWQRNGNDLPGATNSRLHLTNLQSADAGSYRVIVTNALGQVVTRAARLIVLGSIYSHTPAFTNPRLLIDGSFGVSITDSEGAPLLLSDLSHFTAEVSTNMLNWEQSTNALSLVNGTLLLLDPSATNFSTRFYRILQR